MGVFSRKTVLRKIPVSLLFLVANSLSFQAKAECLSKKEILERVCARKPSEDAFCEARGRKLLGAYAESCIGNRKLSNLIPGILKLKTGESIPPKVYEKYGATKIAESMTYRLFQAFERKRIENDPGFLKPKFDPWAQGRIELVFSGKSIHTLIERGFLNSYQTAATAGVTEAQSKLFLLENTLMGLKTEPTLGGTVGGLGVLNMLRPKYANFGYERPSGDIRPGYYGKPGDVVAVMNSDVKRRAEWSTGDAYDLQYHYDDSCEKYRHSFYDPTQLDFTGPDLYYGAQIWGELSLKEVAYFLVGCFGASPDQSFFDSLKNLETPVPSFKCKLVTFPNGAQVLQKEDSRALGTL